MKTGLKNIQTSIIYFLVFLLPLVVTTLFPNSYFVTKTIILTVGISLALLVWFLGFGLTGKAKWGFGKFDIGVLLLGASYLASALIKTPNKMEAFLLPGSATVILGATLLYFLINQLEREERKTLISVIFYSAVVFSLISLLSVSGILANLSFLPQFVKQEGFNTLGGYLPAAIFLASTLPLGIGIFIKESEAAKKMLHGASLLIAGLALIIAVNGSLPGKELSPKLTDFGTSWNVAIDTLQISPAWGIGSGNYVTAFNRFRPLSYNQTDLWNLRFTSARNFYLTAITETGLVGTFALVVLLLAVYRLAREKLSKDVLAAKNMKFISLFLLLILIAVFPASVFPIILLFVLLAVNSNPQTRTINLAAKSSNRIPSLIISLPFVAAIFAFGYFGGKAILAEAKYRTAIAALSQSDGEKTYNTLREAINLNPLVDRYRTTYVQVNLALARNVAQKENITDNDRQTIATLVQQAIREARAVVALNPTRASGWEILAQTYQAVIAFADGADNFAIQSFNQAIALDPLNPSFRISLGGLYYALGDYDSAINVLRLAVAAKPDHANAHYNLAVAYREKGLTDNAIKEMTNVLSLVDKDSTDYELATSVMASLQQRKRSEAGDTENLTTPTEQEQLLTPPLELPEDTEPPTNAVEPSPSPSPTP